jgi:probable F420-dependent oxidoreductase
MTSRLGIYVLPGRITDPARGITEAEEAERLGLGAIWLSERFALKEPAVLCGAIANATSRVRICGTMYAHVRHPVVSASVCNVLAAISHDRFALVLARSVKEHFAAMGLPPLTFDRLADFISIVRRLWAGEKVSYDGVLGRFPSLYLNDRYAGAPPPIVFTAIGPKALAFAGQYCDGVLLHPFLTPAAVARSAAVVHEAAEKAGRDPKAVKIHATVVTAPELSPQEEAAIVGGRAVTYFQNALIGGLLVNVNGWDPADLHKLHNHPMFSSPETKNADRAFTRDQLAEVSRQLPQWWLTEAAAVGGAGHCAARLQDYFAAGADDILLHGLSPFQLKPLLAALPDQAPAEPLA